MKTKQPGILVISNYRDSHVARPEAEIFVGLAQRGFPITVITYGDAEYVKRFESFGIYVVDGHPTSKKDKTATALIRKVVQERNIKVLVLCNSMGVVCALNAVKDLPVKLIAYRGFAGNVHWYDPTAYMQFLHPRLDKIWCLSKYVEDEWHKQLFFDKSKTEVILKGQDLSWYEGVDAIDLKTELGLTPKDFLIVCVANNRKVKGVHCLLKAANELPKDLPIHIALVGRDMQIPYHLKLVEKGGREAKTHFLGYRSKVLEIIKSSDAVVVPSLREGLSKAMIEALALQIPLISSAVPSSLEILEHGKNALIFPVNDHKSLAKQIVYLINNPQLKEKFAKAGLVAFSEALSLKNTVDKFEQMVLNLVSKS